MIDLINYLNAKDPSGKKQLIVKYVMHEALENTSLDHYEIIRLTENDNVPVNQNTGEFEYGKTELGQVLRQYIDNNVGGIDFNPANMNLQTAGEQVEFQLPFDVNELEHMNIHGFKPIIIQMRPIVNLPLLLGLVDEKGETPVAEFRGHVPKVHVPVQELLPDDRREPLAVLKNNKIL